MASIVDWWGRLQPHGNRLSVPHIDRLVGLSSRPRDGRKQFTAERHADGHSLSRRRTNGDEDAGDSTPAIASIVIGGLLHPSKKHANQSSCPRR